MSSLPPPSFFHSEDNFIYISLWNASIGITFFFQRNSEFKIKISMWPIYYFFAISFLVSKDWWRTRGLLTLSRGLYYKHVPRFPLRTWPRQRWWMGGRKGCGSRGFAPERCGFKVAHRWGQIPLRIYRESNLTKTVTLGKMRAVIIAD